MERIDCEFNAEALSMGLGMVQAVCVPVLVYAIEPSIRR